MKTIKLVILILLWSTNICRAQTKHVTILHTNDVHSQIEPIVNGLGGIVRAATYINEVRAVEKNVLLLSAGDFFQGTPYFNLFFGKIEIELMNAMRYDVACLGNHEFDYGLDTLAKRLREAQFTTVSANYDVSRTLLHDLVKPYTIIEKGGLKIGIVGIGLEFGYMVLPRHWSGLQIANPVETANIFAKQLKETDHCDIVVCLSHIGYEDDIKLAENSHHIDVIIGGHSHTLLEQADIRKNLDGKDVTIVQTGSKGLYVGRVDISTDK